jgi:hypothetical protein
VEQYIHHPNTPLRCGPQLKHGATLLYFTLLYFTLLYFCQQMLGTQLVKFYISAEPEFLIVFTETLGNNSNISNGIR